MSLTVYETAIGFSYTIASISAGTSEKYPIPGLSYGVDGLAIGAYADVGLNGNADSLSVTIGLDGCVSIPIVGTECGSDIPISGNPFPYNVLTETW